MTIPSELQLAYNQITETLQTIEGRARPLLEGVAKLVGGRYEGRIKPVASLLAKIEKDGPEHPLSDLDDLYAGRIIVPDASRIAQTEKEVARLFVVTETIRPRTRRPEEFIYDDRHLILKFKPDRGRDEATLANVAFELQIKTVMQAAAADIARPLAYKPRWLSWAKARLVSRIRATVELADDLLEKLAGEEVEGPQPPIEHYEFYARLNSIIQVLEQHLASEQIPDDRRRLAGIVDEYLKTCQPEVTLNELERILKMKEYKAICSAISISAAGAVFMVLFCEGCLLTKKADARSLRGERRFLITREMIDLCPELGAIPPERRVDLTVP